MKNRDSAFTRLEDLVIPVDKSAGISTYDVIRRFKRSIRVSKVGHSGTLDPPATGLILILTGRATKLSEYMMDLPKKYTATIRLGESTDTQDADGEVVRTGEWEHITREDIAQVLPGFTGTRMQVPPMYSALKHKGRPLYRLAREGREVEREPREVVTYGIELTGYELPFFTVEVHCSRGMYVRVLAEELGEALGTPAHLYSLVRTEIGHFSLDSAMRDDRFDELAKMEDPGYTMADALQHLTPLTLDRSQARNLMNGIAPRMPGNSASPGSLVRLLLPDGRLGAVAEVKAAGIIGLRKVFAGDIDDTG